MSLQVQSAYWHQNLELRGIQVKGILKLIE